MKINYFFLDQGILKVIPHERMPIEPEMHYITGETDLLPFSWQEQAKYKLEFESAKSEAIAVQNVKEVKEWIVTKSPNFRLSKIIEGELYQLESEIEIKPIFIFNAGNYSNTCSVCKNEFSGCDKMQFVCKSCCEKPYAFISISAEKPKEESQYSIFKDFIDKVIHDLIIFENTPETIINKMRNNFTITRK